MATENKEDLFKKIAMLEAQLLPLKQASEEFVLVKKQLADALKSKDEIIANEHSVRQREEKLQAEIASLKKGLEAKDKQIDAMKVDLNKLAILFDEYIVAYQDQVKMLGVFVKNTQTVEKYLAAKIEDFNGGNKK
jgi:predicted RNase H-like nuclease (RuvC/YqgF family)